MITSLVALLLLIAGILTWLRFAKAKEIALMHVKHYCQKENLDWLDETISLRRIQFCRDSDGRVCIKRVYRYRCYDASKQKELIKLFTLVGLEPEQAGESGVVIKLSDFRKE